MNASTLRAPQTLKAARPSKKQPPLRCRLCPLRDSWGQCLDRQRKSGRCGDWVWYVRGGKQLRHLYVKPHDPRTSRQRNSRAQFGAASKRYGEWLTEKQQEACIAAAAKVQSRPRLGQSGSLTGQQYWIRRYFAAKAAHHAQAARSGRKALQIKGIVVSTSGTRRRITGSPPGNRRNQEGRTPVLRSSIARVGQYEEGP
jgi:hypothetical protein